MNDNQNSHISSEINKLFGSGTVILFICASTKEFPLLSVSKNSKNILGFEPSYFLEHSNSWSSQIHPEDRERVFQQFGEVISEGKAVISEYRFKRKDGQYIWLRDELKLVEHPEKDTSLIYGSSFDISNRKKAELAFKKSKKQYQSVVEHIKDVIYKIDAEGRLVFLNKSWEEHTGYPVGESCGESFRDFIHPEDRESFDELYQQLVEREIEAGTQILRCLKKDEGFYWAEVYAKRLQGETGKEPLITGTLIDVSKDIARQQKVEAINRRLEDRVDQRSEGLEEEIEKRKEAEKRLQKRLSYEKAISKCSSLLLESTSSEALRKSLTILLDVTVSDRVYLYKNQQEDDQLYLKSVVEVTARGVEPVAENSDRAFNYSDIPWWHEKLSEREIIHAQIDEVPEPEHTILKEQQVKSLLVIPITVNQEWYGYVGFADTREKRIWHNDEISLLKTAAGIIAAFEKRKVIEESLIRQRNYTETILDSLPSIYLLMNEDLQVVQWNSNAEQYTEYGEQELQDKSIFDLVASEDHEKLREATERAREDKGEGSELTLVTKSGEEIPYYWRGYYIEFNQEKYFLCVGLDITLQKQTERELMNEKRFNEALVESLPGIFYMIDTDENYHRWNQNFVDQLGYSSAEIKDMTPADFYTDKEYQRIATGIQEVFETGESEIETTIITKDGDEIPYYLTGKLFARDGKNYLVGVGYDISEQIKAREEIRKSEELFRNLFLQAPAAIVMVGPDNKVQYINKSFKDLFGYTEEELRGKDIDEAIVPENEYEEAPKMPGTNYSMDSFHKEAQRLTKDGSLVDVFVAAIPVFVDDEPLAGFGMYIDITEQKKYEEEIYTSLKEKHVLLQEIHHRVKNNLAVVSGLLQLQMYETDDPVIRETLEESENRIQTMALIHEKLYNSQNLSRISCDSYIGDLVETIRNTISPKKDISVVTNIENVKLNINKAVPFALLVNEVITNSFKHAFEDEEEGTITITMHKEGEQVQVHISDDGKGLPDGSSPEKRDSLGMTLIHNFVRQLEADWELGTDNGTYLDLTFHAGDVKGSSSGIMDL